MFFSILHEEKFYSELEFLYAATRMEKPTSTRKKSESSSHLNLEDLICPSTRLRYWAINEPASESYS